MKMLWQDLRHDARMLLKRPGFTLVAVITLALGIGATTAIFTVVNAVLLRPLPYPEAERIMRVGQQFGNSISGAGEPNFLFWREHSRSFGSLAAYQYIGSGFNLFGGNESEFVNGLRVSASFFRALGVSPALGRSFTLEEDQTGGDPVVILSDGLWHRRFGADVALIGKTVLLNGQGHTVVGVMPPQFRFLPHADILVPMRPTLKGDPNPNQTVIGRLQPGMTRRQAQAEMTLIAAEYRAVHPNRMQPNESIGVTPYQELFTGGIERLLWILLGAVGLLLLIACANVANLQLARAAGRRKEIAVRMALGAGWSGVARLLLVESLLLAVAGGTLGALGALWGTDLLTAAIPWGMIGNLTDITFDWRVMSFTLAISIGTGIFFGLVPASQAGRVDVSLTLKEGGGKGAAGPSRGPWREGLVIIEVGLALILLIAATLLVRTFANLRGVDPGFDPRHVLTFYISPQGDRYDSTSKTAVFFDQALERIRSLPGVETAATTNVLPLVAQLNLPVELADRPDLRTSAQFRMVSGDYFEVLKIRIRGRAFTAADNAAAPNVAIVNETFARTLLQTADPVGRSLTLGRGFGERPRQIIGVAADVKQFGLDSHAPPMAFVPVSQVSNRLLLASRRFIAGYFIVRARGEPLDLGAAIKREMAALDPGLPLSSIRSMEDIVGSTLIPQRFNMLLIGIFASVGFLLAAVGIYGVVSYVATQRTHEIGVRVALGAVQGDVLLLVIGQGMKPVCTGVLLGLIGALALTRLMKSLLFGVGATHPLTFAAVAAALTAVGFLACCLPARRAMKVEPMAALRNE